MLVAFASTLTAAADEPRPLTLHPDNPHYFLFHQQPTLLITSAEHYGAVLNLDFDYTKYLDTLAADGLNFTRIFSGAYVEHATAFNIAKNTLAPSGCRFIAPWLRSDQPGQPSRGNKFDLNKWDAAYFARLKDFVVQANQRGIVVEFTFFCPMYEEAQWKLSPMNAANNVNGLGSIGPHEVYTLDKNGGLLAMQESLVRKVVRELRDSQNLCYEICNEPYFGGVTMEWQHHVADIIVATEKDFPHQHLISQNIANGSQKIAKPHPAVSIFNFHYANPPTTVEINYELNKVIGDDETGFKGTGDDHYRLEAWEFILAGGGLYNNLDYSFAVGHEDGTFQYPPKQPGGGNAGFRKQMKFLKDFIYGFKFVNMKPARDLIHENLPGDAKCQLLAEPGQQYAVYFKHAATFEFTIELPAASYHVGWFDVVNGREVASLKLIHSGGVAKFQVPAELSECSLKLMRYSIDGVFDGVAE